MKQNLFLMMLSLILLNSMTIYAQFGGGKGTESEPYQIKTANHLAELATKVNGGELYSGKYFKMMNDIDLSQWIADNNPSEGWTPIGYYIHGQHNKPFKGIFDGDSYTISGMYINQPNKDAVGLFGYTFNSAKIQNIYLKGSSITGNYYVGGIVGRMAGNVEKSDRQVIAIHNCHNYVNINGDVYTGGIAGAIDVGDYYYGVTKAEITSCCNMATIKNARYGNIGGIAGVIWGGIGSVVSFSKCDNYGSIESASATKTGGIVGSVGGNASFASCTNCSNIAGGDYIGGIMGYYRPLQMGPECSISIALCYTMGQIVGGNNIGGIFGYCDKGYDVTCGLTIQSSYAAVKVISTAPVPKDIGGIYSDIKNAGDKEVSNNYFDRTLCAYGADEEGVTGYSTEQMQQQSSFSGWNFASVANMWNIWEGKSYPYYQWQSAPVANVAKNGSNLDFELRNKADSVVLFAYMDNQQIRKQATGTLNAGTNSMKVVSKLEGADFVCLVVYESQKTQSYPVFVEDFPIVGINPVSLEKAYSVYPNPATTEIFVGGDIAEVTDYSIYNISGQKVMGGVLEASGSLNIQSLGKGVYFLRIDNNTMKFVKQ